MFGSYIRFIVLSANLSLLVFLVFSCSNKSILRVNHIESSRKSTSVFYPKYIKSDQCQAQINLLKEGKLKFNEHFIGFPPDWTIQNYSLHSLRFLSCLIWEAEQGNIESFNLAKDIILDWDRKNQFAKKINNWTWKDNKGAWEEHGVSWRAVLLSYFYQVVQKLSPDDQRLIKHLHKMAKAHGDFLSLSKPYMSHHNHGINNAIGLLALGTAFQELPDANKWVDLSLIRAEQQMEDNVSTDGIHLEHSGFYQFYTLRTFIEIYQTAQIINRPLSDQYRRKLDKMLEVGALMAGANGKVEGIPWNMDFNVFEYIQNINSLDLGKSMLGKQLFEKTKQGYSARGLSIKKEGGYSFFSALSGKELEIIFHTRILQAPHFQADALGLTAILGNQRILSYGNYNNSSRQAKDFNTVQVSNLKQNSTLKLNPRISLRNRLLPSGGEVLAFESFPKLDFVTAQNQLYPKVTHTRTVARIGTHYLLVWDRLEADKEHEYTQSFHFSVPLKVVVQKEKGVAKLGEKPIVQFRQLVEGTEVITCETISQSQLCSWEHDGMGNRIPTPEINYLTLGKGAEFLSVFYAGAGQWSSSVKTVSDHEPKIRIVSLFGEGGNYRVRLQDLKLSLE